MPQPQMSPRAEQVLEEADEAYARYHDVVLSDPDYPALHVAPPVGRLNDPNGLVYHNGVYHAFFQYAPNHPARDIFWRHVESRDLVHWSEGKNAIAPTHMYDRNGCYSGSCFVAEDGTYEFFYTGNVKHADGRRESHQALAISSDNCRTFEKHPANPLISGVPEGYTPHFRDPYVYERNGRFYAMIGAQHEDHTGAIVLYSSADRRRWEFEGELEFSDPEIASYGYMLECPQVVSLRDRVSGQTKDVLLFCPQGMEAQGERFNNKYQSGYVVGTLNGLHFEVETAFTEFDAGFEFYAPQVFHGSSDGNRVLMTAWMGISDQDEMPSWDHRWLHMFVFPRWLSLRAGKIYQEPAEGLDAVLPLREQVLGQDGVLEAVRDARVFRISGELNVESGPVQIVISDDRGPAFVVELAAEHLWADRSGSKYTVWGPQRKRSSAERKGRRTFDLFLDASAVEVFADGGETVMSGRSFFHGSTRKVQLLTPAGQSAGHRVINVSAAVLNEN